MKARIAHPNPDLLKWARSSINYSLEEASAKLHIDSIELSNYENGIDNPSFTLLRKMSEIYKRPLSVLYLPVIPRNYKPMNDYRKVAEKERVPFSPELSLLIRETIERSMALKEIMEDEDTQELDFVGSYTTLDDEVIISENIRSVLGISEDEIFSSRQEALNQWIDKVENIGVFVFQTGNEAGKKISVNEARGFVISDKMAPFIFLNENDAKAARIFTLVHELAHLWLDDSGVSNIGFRNIDISDYDPIEIKCNKIAANVLLPPDSTKNFIDSYIHKIGNIEQVVDYISLHYKVSKTMVSRRMYDLGYLNKQKYFILVNKFHEEWEKIKAYKDSVVESKAGPSYYLMKSIHNGKMFTKYVLGLYNSQQITPSFASSLLGAKVNNFYKISKEVGL